MILKDSICGPFSGLSKVAHHWQQIAFYTTYNVPSYFGHDLVEASVMSVMIRPAHNFCKFPYLACLCPPKWKWFHLIVTMAAIVSQIMKNES
jgi:hypothetical protein